MVYKIRKVQSGDAAALAHVQGTSWNETYRGLLPDSAIDFRLAPEGFLRSWSDRLQADPGPFLNQVAVASTSDGERVVGFVTSGPSRSPQFGLPGEVLALYLLGSEQGRGVGRLLWEAAIDELRERSLCPGFVWVLADNRAAGFYQHLGATEIARRECQVPGASHLEEIALRFDG